MYLFDIDGSLTRGGGRNDHPHAVPQETAEALSRASERHTVVLVTGQPTSVAARMREQLGGLAGAPIAPEYGSLLLHANGEQEVLLPRQQAEEFFRMRQRFERAVLDCGGELDHRKVVLGLNGFWPSAESFHAAQAEWVRIVESDRDLHHAFTANGVPAPCRFQWNSGDFSMNVLPADAGKHIAVGWAQARGRILIAGGDTGSDVPLLRAAVFPVALHDEGEEMHPALAAVVNEMGRGYIAPAHEPHGLGVLSALRKAAQEGLIQF